MRTLLAVVAFASMLFASHAANAEVRIANDPGGNVSQYIARYHQMRAAGEHVVIDGPCISACTLLTGIIPRQNVCVTPRAVLGFHMASYVNDAGTALIPTRSGTAFVMRQYPADIRAWIKRNGGLKVGVMFMRGAFLNKLYASCN